MVESTSKSESAKHIEISEETPENDSALKAATVEHKTFDELTDIIKDENIDIEEFFEKTKEMSNTTSDEEWRPQYDAI